MTEKSKINAQGEDRRKQRIFLVRHAKPELPHEGRLYYGHTDYPLSQEGIETAEQLADALAGIPFEKAYSSDLARARQTAEILLKGREEPLIVTPSLREIYLGEWEGKSFDEVRATWTELYEKRGASFDSVPPPSGESFLELQKRAAPALEEIMTGTPYGNILVVAHAAFIWSVMCHYFTFSLNDLFYYPMDYCGVHILQNDMGLIRMVRYNWNLDPAGGKFKY